MASPLNPEGQVREHLPLVFPVVPLRQSRAPTPAHRARQSFRSCADSFFNQPAPVAWPRWGWFGKATAFSLQLPEPFLMSCCPRSVDVTCAPNTATQTQLGVSNRRAQGCHFTGPHSSSSKPRRVPTPKGASGWRRLAATAPALDCRRTLRPACFWGKNSQWLELAESCDSMGPIPLA